MKTKILSCLGECLQAVLVGSCIGIGVALGFWAASQHLFNRAEFMVNKVETILTGEQP